MKRAMWWLKKPGSNSLILGEISPLDLDGSVVTVAGMLQLILESGHVKMLKVGLDIMELDIWYE